jgi:hypothetical protein
VLARALLAERTALRTGSAQVTLLALACPRGTTRSTWSEGTGPRRKRGSQAGSGRCQARAGPLPAGFAIFLGGFLWLVLTAAWPSLDLPPSVSSFCSCVCAVRVCSCVRLGRQAWVRHAAVLQRLGDGEGAEAARHTTHALGIGQGGQGRALAMATSCRYSNSVFAFSHLGHAQGGIAQRRREEGKGAD